MRLIDADSLKDRLSEYAISESEYKRFCEIVDTEPTAYDVDAVIERLKGRREAAFHAGNKITLGDVYGLDDAIEIVKAGGSYGK